MDLELEAELEVAELMRRWRCSGDSLTSALAELGLDLDLT